MNDARSLRHTVWECKYHVVWIPKYWRKAFYLEPRRHPGETIRGLDLLRLQERQKRSRKCLSLAGFPGLRGDNSSSAKQMGRAAEWRVAFCGIGRLVPSEDALAAVRKWLGTPPNLSLALRLLWDEPGLWQKLRQGCSETAAALETHCLQVVRQLAEGCSLASLGLDSMEGLVYIDAAFALYGLGNVERGPRSSGRPRIETGKV